jgi:TRAP-type mannitol/chloroaromatic compound transport system substrate-binding protein
MSGGGHPSGARRQRREVLTAAAGALAAGGLAAPALAQTAPAVSWRLTSSFPKSLDTIFGAAETLARLVGEASEGRFRIQTFAAGEIVPGLQALDAVTSGAVECAQTPTYFYVGKDPALALGTGLAFGLNARLQQAWWQFGGGEAIVNAALARHEAIALAMGNSGCQMGGWFRREIREPADLKGLKFRIGGLGGRILARLGVVPQQIAAGDVYGALERGTIDAAEFVGPYDDEKLGFAKVARNYYYPGFWEGGAMLHLVVGRSAFERLPRPFQAILRQAAEAAGQWMLAKYDTLNAPALRRLLAGGVELRPFPPSVMDAARQAAAAVHAELAAANPGFKAGFESLEAFRREQYAWWQVGEHAFDSYQIVGLRR